MKKVTVLMCTPDLASETTRQCLDSLFAHTTSALYKLVIADNLSDPAFSHPHEINKQLNTLDTDYLVTLDDDVVLTAGWLDALLEVAEQDASVGAVGCVHTHADGTINHSGGWILRDGRSVHFRLPLRATEYVPYVCSACMLIRQTPMRFDETFQKYWHEGEFCLRLWESGHRVAVSPHRICHLTNRQMVRQYGVETVATAREADRAVFVKKWVDTGRLPMLFQAVSSGWSLPEPPAPLAGSDVSLVPSILRLYVREILRSRSIAKKRRETIAVFGAGAHTEWLERVLRDFDDGPPIAAVLDDRPRKNKAFFGMTPIAPDTFDANTVEAILLSSDSQQAVFAKRCRELYGEKVELLDVYEGLPPGPYYKGA